MVRSKDQWQHTLADVIEFVGVGVHSGQQATLTLSPAECDSGIVFVRTDLSANEHDHIPARHHLTATTELATVIGNKSGAAVSTIEHVMAALYGLGIDNAVIAIDGPEVPILDGSSQPFVEAIEAVGLEIQEAPRRFLRVKSPVRVTNGAQFGELLPHDCFALDVEIVYPDVEIGRQRVRLDVTEQSFSRELSGARTFGFLRDVERLRAAGYARGASLDNTVVIDDGQVLNEGKLRYVNEFVRHKALDAVGDLALIGMPLLGLYRSSRGGHKLNSQVVAALLANPANYEIVEHVPARAPSYARSRVAGMNGVAAQPAFAPEGR